MRLRALARQAEIQTELLAWEQQDRIEEGERILRQKREKILAEEQLLKRKKGRILLETELRKAHAIASLCEESESTKMSNNDENGGPQRERDAKALPLPDPFKHRGTLSNPKTPNNNVKQQIVTQVARPAITNLAAATVNSNQISPKHL